MKKVILGVLASFMLAACVPPSDYCDKVTRNVDATTSALQDISGAIKLRQTDRSEESKENLKKTYEESLETVQESWKTIRGMSDFRGDDELRQSADQYVGFFASYYENQLKSVVEILSKDSTTYDDQAEMMEYIYELSGKESKYKEQYQKSLLKFMKKNELTASGF